jgi:acetyl-CoA C-acetyltransferase
MVFTLLPRATRFSLANSNAPHSIGRDVLIVSAVRTPVGSFNGTLKKLTATELGIVAGKKAMEKAGVKPDQIEDVYMGNVLQGGVGQSPARQVALGMGCPDSTEATTINKVCSVPFRSISAFIK